MNRVTVIGAGLAGCEAAWQIARRQIPVTLIDMKPERMSPAHHSPLFAELVCSNSLKATRPDSAAGMLKEEMRLLGSLCIEAALQTQVAAGGALAVDREAFARRITDNITAHPLITVACQEVEHVPAEGLVVLATGPLTAGPLAADLSRFTGKTLAFYDAASPIVTADSIDDSIAFTASRYQREAGGDYLNCPFNEVEYTQFFEALLAAECVPRKTFEQDMPVYEGCLPIEVMARRGKDTIRFGPLKPVGLRDPRTGHRPWAVVQLRRENAAGTLYNLVGFQTNLKFPEQKRVFTLIPGLEHAEFARYGVMHRNSFVDSPRCLGADYALRRESRIFLAGQLTGVEGYMESASSGILAGINAVRRIAGQVPLVLPPITMMGALAQYISDPATRDFQPMGANLGILPPPDEPIRDKRQKHLAQVERGLKALRSLIEA